MWKRGKLAFLLLLLQVSLIIVYALCVQYEVAADASNGLNSMSEALGGNAPKDNSIEKYYSMFQDVNVMVFIGFGFLMTFLKRYGFGAVGFTLLIAALSIQWAAIVRGVWHARKGWILVDVLSLVGAEFAAASVLISFGAVLGKTSPLQLVVMAAVEVVLFACNEHLGVGEFKAVDIGGSIFLHMFGAYFGLAVSFMLNKKEHCDHRKEGSVYHSDIFAMIGTLFLWVFWPSFNAVSAYGDARHRAVLNTFLALVACTITSYAVSALPLLSRKLRIHDTCGVNNLHGMPGILAGITSAVIAASATEDEYNYSLYTLYPARAPTENSTDLSQVLYYTVEVVAGEGRTAGTQALYQLAAMACTLAIAVAGGLLTGLLMRLPLLDPPKEDELFDDYPSWEVEADPSGAEEAASRPPTKGNQIAMVEQQPDSASRARLPAHFNGAYDAPPPAP
ncbi:hypothetical protein HPB50_026144 [Hyalomma asiaticum]|uniref:Uncharacterized protein n=1 Tax=Hyalomma asiaticum TaxID=266040 RepID=A0ACB7SAJ8_HYAAI|nr:hypothetical protein HPB50_026144 [Hyalomma asiaticum]